MACINMFNNDQQVLYNSSIGPRISFSNDFADTQQAIKQENNYKEAPVSSDFEFSVTNYSMKHADDIFFKGVLLPLTDECTNKMQKITLRDELLVDDEDEDVLPRLLKNPGRWKERLGLKRMHPVPKRGDKRDLERIVEEKGSVFAQEETTVISKIMQEPFE